MVQGKIGHQRRAVIFKLPVSQRFRHARMMRGHRAEQILPMRGDRRCVPRRLARCDPHSPSGKHASVGVKTIDLARAVESIASVGQPAGYPRETMEALDSFQRISAGYFHNENDKIDMKKRHRYGGRERPACR